MTNIEIARLLKDVAAAYAIKNESKYRFQIIAYLKASDAIEHSTTEVSDLAKEDQLGQISGVGPSLQEHLKELISSGKVKHFEKIMEDIPQALFPILDIPSFGPKKAFKLVSHFKLNDPKSVIKEIKKLAEEGKIAELEGFGDKSQSDILRAVNEYAQGVNKTSRMVLPFAGEIAEKLIDYMKKCPDVQKVSTLGSLRRRKETIGDVDIAVASNEPVKVIEYFINYPYKDRIIEKGPATSSLLISGGKHIDLMVQPPEAFGSLLQHFTGSKEHNVHLREYALKRGLSLSEYGIRQKDNPEKLKQYDDEVDFYKALGLSWIPPEIRENTGEIELAQKNELPTLVELKDMKGDFHLHSNFPIEPSHDMGIDTMETMIKKAESLGYAYLGFSEHNPSQSKHTDKQIYDILIKRSNKIDQLNKSNKNIRVFSLLETDILPNGSLAISDDALSLLDATLVSIHSVFSMDKITMTKRVLKGLSHPKAKVLTHPTGRLINERPGYELDWNEIFAFCKSENKALEINAFPSRLDLSDQLVRQAVEQGVKLFIDTDSHAVGQMELMQYGVSVARRGWATKDDILNAQEYNKLVEFFNS
ncbi:DNA polymerase/3'-5' exonuclease PolX [soil metagenome]